jgi:hypothetical protein
MLVQYEPSSQHALRPRLFHSGSGRAHRMCRLVQPPRVVSSRPPAATVKAGPLLLRRRRRRRRRHGFDGTRPSGRRCMHDVRAGGRPHRRRPQILGVGTDGQDCAMRTMHGEVRLCGSSLGSDCAMFCRRVRRRFARVPREVHPRCRLQELCDGMPRRWVRATAPHTPPPSPLTPLPRLPSHPSPVSPPTLPDCTMTGVSELDDPADPAVATPARPPCLQRTMTSVSSGARRPESIRR